MKRLYEKVLYNANKRLDEEKETALSAATVRAISLAMQLHNHIKLFPDPSDSFENPCTTDIAFEQ